MNGRLSAFRRIESGEDVIRLAIRIALLAFLIYWSFVLVRPFIPILVWSVVLTVALYPFYAWLSRNLGERPKTAAIVITAAQTHPSVLAVREFIRSPITFGSLLSITTSTTRGGAKTPLRTADQNNILTALSPAKSRARPTTIAIAITP